jgi:uncharacterized membrane protein YccC
MALLQVHLLNPSTAFAVTERLVDTFVGGLLAFAFSFVWPSWERQTIPQQIEGLLRANRKYLDAILTEATADVEYRLARKQLFDAVAALTGSLRRMLNEPKSHHRAVRELNEFITVDYLLAAHAASVHLLLENSKDALEEAETHADLSRAQVVSGELLGQAVAAWRPEPGARPAPRTVEESNWDESLYAEVQWTPAMLLKRRLRLIQETAYKLASLSANIAAQW